MNSKSDPFEPEQALGKSIEVPAIAPIRSVNSLELLDERGELKIEHNGEQYSLRRTRHGKLILTK